VTIEKPQPSLIRAFSLLFLLGGGFGCGSSQYASSGVDAGAGPGSTTSTTSTGTGSGAWDGGGSLWVDLYYPGWKANRLPPEALDLGGVTHIIHFAWIPWIAEGGTAVTIDDTTNGVGADAAAAIIQVGHAAGKKVLISIGGSQKGSLYFNQAMADAARPAFIQSLISMAVERGYDGIDVDWEPGWNNMAAGTTLFQQFSRDLRAAVDAAAPQLILTTAGLGASGDIFGPVAGVYDQINIMTYDLVYGVPLAWHNSAISGGTGAYYSVDRAGIEYERARVPKGKLGVGLKCGGYSWANAQKPMDNPLGAAPRSVPYASIMTMSYSDAAYRWDDKGQVPYLSIATPAPAFITYDDARSAKAKIDFLRTAQYGGLIIWDSSEQYFPAGDAMGEKHPLLRAVQQAVAGN
jgi:chitinase